MYVHIELYETKNLSFKWKVKENKKNNNKNKKIIPIAGCSVVKVLLYGGGWDKIFWSSNE